MSDYKEGSDEDILATAKKRFQACLSAESENRESALEDTRFYAASPDNGYQWPEKIKSARENDPNGPRPCLTINKLPQHVRQVTNEQRQNRPQIKTLPVDSHGDVEIAEIYNGIIRHIEVQSDADIAYDTACEHQVVGGEGFFRILTDYTDDNSFDQEILIKRIKNPFSVHMDPEIHDPTGADQRYCFIAEDMPEEEFEKKYPKAQKIDWSFDTKGDMSNWYSTGAKKVRIAEYFYTEYREKTLLAYPNGWTGFKEDVPEGEEIPEGAKSRKVITREVKWCMINGKEVLEKREWASRYIPVLRVVGNEIVVDGKTTVSGLVRNAKDPQRMYNYWSSQETEMLALAPKAPFIGAQGQFEGLEAKWQAANIKNFAYLEYKPVIEGGTLVPPPQRQMPPMAQQGFITAKQGAAEDIKGTTGQYDASLGMQSNETSGIAIQRRQREGDVANFHYVDNLSRALRQAGRIILDLIPKIYDVSRIVRIIGEDGTPDHVVIDPKQQEAIKKIMSNGKEVGKSINPNIGRYDVTVVVGPSYTTKRQEAAEGMVQLTQSNPNVWPIIGDLLVRNMDWPGAEEMAERLKAMLPDQIKALEDKGQDPKMQQAQQTIEQLKQQLEATTQFVKQLQQGFEAAKADKAKMDSVIAAYEAETNRLKVVQPTMTPEEISALCLKTFQQLMTGSDVDPGQQQTQTQQPQQPQ
jgi:hypothetical protein